MNFLSLKTPLKGKIMRKMTLNETENNGVSNKRAIYWLFNKPI